MGATWYFVWSADMGFGLAALAAFLRRVVGRAMVGGGRGGGEDGGKMERSKVGSDKSCCGHRPAANHRSPISAATPGTSGNMSMWNELRNCLARDCFLCASTTE